MGTIQADPTDSPTLCVHCSRPIHMAAVAWCHDGGTIYCDTPPRAEPAIPGRAPSRRYELNDNEADFISMVLMNWNADRLQCIQLAGRLESGR